MSDPGPDIRPAAPADLPQVARIVAKAYGRYVALNGLVPGPMRDDYAARQAAGQLWVLDDGTVRGILVLVEGDGHLLLDNVAIDPGAQGKGYGRMLLDFAENRARQTGLPAMRLYTQEIMVENIAIYAARGYAETHRATELGLRRVYMEKRL
ncbi:L-amino acid N-acyltransferase YncA [Paracoccus aminovorans]|uniref:L-amino acid N-acyltransferase YncA n=1 Tax=Paracoccus aminovorans TaxID=34004 RepID=A0A1I3CSK5_9RHOB|nr:GNAT family N-acetyltransferase [Paracoccus aminovorans]CQR85904.1 GNAT family acetyltransferase [Paracoccus aminovorans]SFH77495.1 L-amino acid N-acyltransferase YncA [Paracoccus aminovorans]